jgi:hypothetical protein
MKNNFSKLLFLLFFWLFSLISYAQKIDFSLPYLPFKEDTTTLYKKCSQDRRTIYTKASTNIQEIILDNAGTNVWAYVYKENVICKVELYKDFIFDMKPAQVLAAYVDTTQYREANKVFKQTHGISLAETMVIRSWFDDIFSYSFGFAVGAGGMPNRLCFQMFSLVVDKKYDSLAKMLNSFKPTLRYSGYVGLKMASNYGYIPSELVKKQLLDFEKENIMIPYKSGCDGDDIIPLQSIITVYGYSYYQTIKLAELEKLVEELKRVYVED